VDIPNGMEHIPGVVEDQGIAGEAFARPGHDDITLEMGTIIAAVKDGAAGGEGHFTLLKLHIACQLLNDLPIHGRPLEDIGVDQSQALIAGLSIKKGCGKENGGCQNQ
jgi:hypothetical protein